MSVQSQYHLDFTVLPLNWLQRKIAEHELVPARQLLRDDLRGRFEILRQHGVATMDDLVRVLRTRDRVADFAKHTRLPHNYLTWLGREARSYRPNPFALRAIPGCRAEFVSGLEAVGIKTTKRLFDSAAARRGREKLSSVTTIPESDLLVLVKMADLARIRGMGSVFVRLFTVTGADCVDALASWSPSALRGQLMKVNSAECLSSVVPSLKDIREYVEMANELPKALSP